MFIGFPSVVLKINRASFKLFSFKAVLLDKSELDSSTIIKFTMILEIQV